MSERARGWRGVGARLFVAVALGAQLFFIVRAYWDPHRHFGFQPFPESSTWKADLVRVTADGRRVPIRGAWTGGYAWPRLVRGRGLDWPVARHHADFGIGSTLLLLQKALDYVATHTPRDRETLYLEADVTYWYNTRGPYRLVLRSRDRPEARR